MKVALVHDWLTNMGGSEKVVLNFMNVYKDAPIYTSLLNKDKIDSEFSKRDIYTTFLQKIRNANKNHQKYLPFFPVAFEQFDLNDYDIVLSSSNSCSKSVVTSPYTMHVCYCHTPMRYAWEFYNEYMNREKMGKLKKTLIPYIMNYLRVVDVAASNRVDYFIANSENVARRIWKHYRRESTVIHPPVKASFFNISNVDEDYFLVLSRLVAYKRVDIAVDAFNKLGLPLVIIGDGPEKEKLQQMAKSNISFLGRLNDDQIKEYYSKCKAFIFPGEEDFGITPLEAQASGRPVIAYRKGGVLETVVEGKTGLFFDYQTSESLSKAVELFKETKFYKEEIREHALKFDESVFQDKINRFIEEKYNEFKKEVHHSVFR